MQRLMCYFYIESTRKSLSKICWLCIYYKRSVDCNQNSDSELLWLSWSAKSGIGARKCFICSHFLATNVVFTTKATARMLVQNKWRQPLTDYSWHH